MRISCERCLSDAPERSAVTAGLLHGTISADGVTCSTFDAADAPEDVPPVRTLPILDEIATSVTVKASGSSLTAVRAAGLRG